MGSYGTQGGDNYKYINYMIMYERAVHNYGPHFYDLQKVMRTTIYRDRERDIETERHTDI